MRSLALALFMFALGSVVHGCSAEIPNGKLACAGDQDCPDDFHCWSDQRCHSRPETDGGCMPPQVSGQVVVRSCVDGAVVVQLDGTGLGAVTSVAVGPSTASLVDALDFTKTSTHIDARFAAGTPIVAAWELVLDAGACRSTRSLSSNADLTATGGASVVMGDRALVPEGVTIDFDLYQSGGGALPADALTAVLTGTTNQPTALSFSADAMQSGSFQVLVPSTLPAAVYDLRVADGTGCITTVSEAIRVSPASQVTATLAPQSVFPDVVSRGAYTDVQLFFPMQLPPHVPYEVYLAPTAGGGTAVRIDSMARPAPGASDFTVTVPSGMPTGSYDVHVVGADGSRGVSASALQVATLAPPRIEFLLRGTLIPGQSNTFVAVGNDFRSGMTGSLHCTDSSQQNSTEVALTLSALVCQPGGSCTVQATTGATGFATGDVCFLRLVNSDGTSGLYASLPVGNSGLSLTSSQSGPSMQTPRRAHVALAAGVGAHRFVYALGGDGGEAEAASPYDSVEVAPLDGVGGLGAFQDLPSATLPSPRSFAGGIAYGRHLVLVGGSDGVAALDSVIHAAVLDPAEVPRPRVVYMRPAQGGEVGLVPGIYLYRVSATYSLADPTNPGGESLASPPLVVHVPDAGGANVVVSFAVDPPRVPFGRTLGTVAQYNVYRTITQADWMAEDGIRFLFTEAATGSVTLIDAQSSGGSAAVPPPIGSLTRWIVGSSLAKARMGAGVAWAPDPTGVPHAYVVMGMGDGGQVHADCEYAELTVSDEGRQLDAASWLEPSLVIPSPRWQHALFGLNVYNCPLINDLGDSFLYFGTGLDAGGAGVADVLAYRVGNGGVLSGSTTVADPSVARVGYAAAVVDGRLYSLGGRQGTNIVASVLSSTAQVPLPGLGAWQSAGNPSLSEGRYLAGSVVVDSSIYVLGGATPTAAATTTTGILGY